MDLRINLRVGICYDEWLELLFETGCMFIEDRISDTKGQLTLLEDIDLGFWNWWIETFILDDERLLGAGCSDVFLDGHYKELKQGLAIFRQLEWDGLLS